jgi:GT2 family glycosyltransferase
MRSPRISFIVVTNGRPQCLLRALESIRGQTIDDREIVVVVNGTDRETEEILRRFGPEVRVIVLPKNRGVGAGRNSGIAYARGEVLFFLDDDAELCNRDTANQVLAHFDNDTGLGVVSLLVIDGSTGQIELRCLPFRDKQLPDKATPACYFAGGAAAIRRLVLDRIGLFDECLFYSCEELDLSYRILAADFRILFDPTTEITHYRAGEGCQSMRIYFDARNRPWVALRHLPLPCCVSHCLLWWGRSFVMGLREGVVGQALRGIRDCVFGIPALCRERRPIGRSTCRLLAHNNGRLWY